MTIRSEKHRIRTLLSDTISLLCKNSLPPGFSIEGTIGISSLNDEDDVFIVPIKEVVKCEKRSSSDSDSDATNNSYSVRRKRKRKSRTSKDTDNRPQPTPTPEDPFEDQTRVKLENNTDSDSEDLVMVKEEPSPARLRQLQATPLNATESAAINEAVHNSISNLAQIQSYQTLQHGWSPQHLPNMSPLPISQQQQHHHQQQQQQQTVQHKQPAPQMQGLGQHQPQGMEDFSSKFTVEDMKTIAHRVATTEGMFLTVRLVKRRVSRYPTNFIIKTMREFMSRHPTDPLFLGYYKEPPRTKVFYKCPPDIIREEALLLLGISRDHYREVFNNVPKVQKWDKPEIQGRLLLSVLEASPFMEHYDPTIVKLHSTFPGMKAAVTELSSDGALDLSVDITRVESPLTRPTVKQEPDLEAGELRKPPIMDNHSTLAPLYAMTNLLSKSPTVNSVRPPPAHGGGENHFNSHTGECGEQDREPCHTPTPQQFAEKAIMKSMYQHDNSNGSHDSTKTD